jgi:hypothetical protein
MMTKVPAPDAPPQLERPFRMLLGWLPAEQAERAQVGNRNDVSIPPACVERARAAREAVAARPTGLDQSGAVVPAPSGLAAHIDALKQHQVAAQYFTEGCQVSLVDLRRVVAVQPGVSTDHAEARVCSVELDDLGSIAAVSLPIPGEANLPSQFDESRNVWMLSSANPNLRIVGNFSVPLQPGIVGFGFAAAVTPSFLQVARFQGRYLLRDGYHRAVGFLRRGIHIVPAFTRELGPTDSLNLPAGMLPQGAYLGERPPLLPDYLDDTVSADVKLPALQKMIVIQGTELTPVG